MARFTYRAVAQGGKTVSAALEARDRTEALRQLQSERKVVVSLEETAEGAQSASLFGPRITADDRIQVLRQLAVMVRAGVELLEAIDTVAAAMAKRPISAQLRDASANLRKGRSLADAFRAAVTDYPAYVYALMRAGESSGNLGAVLDEAVRQLAYEERAKKDLQNALTYPMLLVVGGMLSVGFLFYAVVPRFAEMLRNANAQMGWLTATVIGVGDFVSAYGPLLLGVLLVGGFALFASLSTPSGRRSLRAMGYSTPGLSGLLRTRRRGMWARIMAITLGAGVDVLEAASLSGSSLNDADAPQVTAKAIQALRMGQRVDETFLKAGLLTDVDASLIRVGQRSGALPQMFRAVADRNEDEYRDALKRLTTLIEPIAIAIVASAIGVVVLSLVSALASIYDSIG
ncbi:MAG: type II secretion system F family protein [Hyphomonadaceae bacterium]